MSRFKWPKDIKEARDVQKRLRGKVKITQLQKTPEYIAGVDAAFSEDSVICVACLYKFPELKHIEDEYSVTKVDFPYIPGFLSFREGPAIIMTINKLRIKPDIVLFDGQGIAHPEGLGIASHLGVFLNIPTIGCAKSRLVGTYTELGERKGEFSYLIYRGIKIGVVLRTRNGVRPVFVSPGHMIDLKQAMDIVLKCTDKYRIPEPLRRADMMSKSLKKGLS